MANRKALGRGLKALLPDPPDTPVVNDGEDAGKNISEQTATVENIKSIKVAKISPNPFQPRVTFDPLKLEELKNSIAEKGVVQPITVRKFKDGYQLIAGERRLRSVSELGFDSIPAYIMDITTDEEMMELSIIENIHREDLNPIDIANSYRRLIDDCHLTQEVVAKKVGKDRATVANFLRLLKLPQPIQESAQQGEISMGHARALLSLSSNEEQLTLWKKIIKGGLSVRKVEDLIRSGSLEKKVKPAPPTKRTYYLEDAENKLRSKLATKVTIKTRNDGGAIEIEFYENDDLERLITVICGD